jgi:hypothetical protein
MSEPTVIAEFPYRIRWRSLLPVFVFFGGGGVFMSYVASTNQKGLRLFRVIELDPEDASVFKWLIAAGCFAFVALGVVLALQRLFWPMRIVFTPEGIIVPRRQLSWSEILIPYSEIRRVGMYRAQSHDHVELFRSEGRYVINGMRLQSTAAVHEIAKLIRKMCPHLQAT